MADASRSKLTLMVISLMTFTMLGGLQALYGPALPAFSRSLGIDLTQASRLLTSHWVGAAAGVGLMYARPTQFGIRVALGLAVSGTLLIGSGFGLITTFLGAFCCGCGQGMANVQLSPRVLRAFGAKGTAMISLINASFGVGAIISPLVYVWIGTHPGHAYLGISVIAVLIWIAAGQLGEAKSEVATGPLAPFNPRWGLMWFSVVGVGIEATLVGLGPSALIAAGQSETAAAQLLSAFFLAFMASRIVLVFTAHLILPFTLYLGAIFATTALAALAALVSVPIFFVLLGASVGLLFPGFFVAASRAMGEDARVAPTIIAAGLFGGIVAPIILAPLMSHLGQSGFFWVCAAACAATTLGAIIARAKLPALRSDFTATAQS